jgi:hypothetical protein
MLLVNVNDRLSASAANRRIFLRAGALLPLVSLSTLGCSAAEPWSPLPPFTGTPNMTPDKAYSLLLAFSKHVGKPPDESNFRLEKDGSFYARVGSPDMVYSMSTKTLRVMAHVGWREDGMPTNPETLARLQFVASKEPYTLGGGEFFHNLKPWVERPLAAQTVMFTLKQDFSDVTITKERFLADVRWLNYWGHYWRDRSYNPQESGYERVNRPDAELEAERPALEKWARGLMAKGLPP